MGTTTKNLWGGCKVLLNWVTFKVTLTWVCLKSWKVPWEVAHVYTFVAAGWATYFWRIGQFMALLFEYRASYVREQGEKTSIWSCWKLEKNDISDLRFSSLWHVLQITLKSSRSSAIVWDGYCRIFCIASAFTLDVGHMVHHIWTSGVQFGQSSNHIFEHMVERQRSCSPKSWQKNLTFKIFFFNADRAVFIKFWISWKSDAV